MGRTIKNRNVPRPKPVQRILLSEDHVRGRGVLLILLLTVATVAFLYAMLSYLRVESGFREIEANATDGRSCSDEFTFQYELGGGEVSATAEYKAVAALYTEAAEKAYALFQVDESFPEVTSVYDINRHPNEVLTVDEVLYDAFSLLQSYDSRELFLAPIYEDYDNLFQCKDDSETVSFDPYQNAELKADFAKLASYAENPEAVDLELLGDNQVRLKVSEEYQSCAKEMGFENYIDFFWMKNAFIVDYLADVMISKGYTRGAISSYDGFIRNLDERETSYSFPIYDREGQYIYSAAIMKYAGQRSIVYLRNYRMSTQDSLHYYELKNGEIRTSYIDARDGLCKSAVNNLVSYSGGKGCAEVLLSVLPIYIADDFQEESLAAPVKEGIYSIFCKDYVIYYNDASLTLTDLYEKEDVSYTASHSSFGSD